MKKLQFKTNIKCMGCIDTVRPHLEKVHGLDTWEVDLNSPDRVMTVTLEEETMRNAILDALTDAGYSATEIVA